MIAKFREDVKPRNHRSLPLRVQVRHDGGRAAMDAKLYEQPAQMRVHSAGRDVKRRRNLLVRASTHKTFHHLALTRRQTRHQPRAVPCAGSIAPVAVIVSNLHFRPLLFLRNLVPPRPSPARKRRAACPHSRLKRGIAKRPIENMIVKTRRVDNHAAQPRIPLSIDSFGEVSLEAIYATAYAAGVLSGFPGSPASRQSSARRARGSGIRRHQPDERPAANAFRRTPSQRTSIPSTRTRRLSREYQKRPCSSIEN